MSEEHRAGMLEFAEKIGHFGGVQEQLVKRVEALAAAVEKVADKIDVVERSIPPGHVEDHAIWAARAKAAKDSEIFWSTTKCYIAMAIGTKQRLAITALVISGILWIGGAHEFALKLAQKAGALLGINDP